MTAKQELRDEIARLTADRDVWRREAEALRVQRDQARSGLSQALAAQVELQRIPKRAKLVADMRQRAERWRREAERNWECAPLIAAGQRVRAMTYEQIANAYENGQEEHL